MKLRIAISCHPTQGGSGVVATELAMGLAERGHEVHLVAVERPFRLCSDSAVKFHPVRVLDYPLFRHPPEDLCLANALAEVTVRHDIQILHAHYAVPHAVSAMLAAQAVAPRPVHVVTTLHGTDITLVGSDPTFRRICQHAMNHCDGLTAVSQWLADRSMQTFQLTRPPQVISNFVDCDRFSPMNRAAYPQKGEPFRLLHLSNFRPVKRISDIIHTFEQVRKQLPAELILAGDGPERCLAKELAAELGLCDSVQFLEPSVDVSGLYRSAHLFLLLSSYESFGLSALEAMSCGTPVLASCSGGLKEVVREGETGFLRPVGDLKAFGEAAFEILNHPDRWAAMSRRAAEVALAGFCKQMLLDQYEAFYLKILSRPAVWTTRALEGRESTA